MARARARVPKSLNGLLRADWEAVIKQANLGEENTVIAERYLLDAIPQVEIGAELNLDRSTISRRLPGILDKVERAARKMNIC